MALDWGNIGAGAAAGAGMGTAINPGWGTAIGGVVGALGGLLSGGSKKDPLAGIRAQLEAIAKQQYKLAEEVPKMVEKQKANTRDIYAGYQKEGMRNIQENIHAERGFGPTSLESSLTTELMDKLAKSQAAEENAIEAWGNQRQSDIFGTTANMYSNIANVTPPEATSPWPAVAGMGTELIGDYLDSKKFIKPTETSGASMFAPQNLRDDLFTRPGSTGMAYDKYRNRNMFAGVQ